MSLKFQCHKINSFWCVLECFKELTHFRTRLRKKTSFWLRKKIWLRNILGIGFETNFAVRFFFRSQFFFFAVKFFFRSQNLFLQSKFFFAVKNWLRKALPPARLGYQWIRCCQGWYSLNHQARNMMFSVLDPIWNVTHVERKDGLTNFKERKIVKKVQKPKVKMTM